MSTNAVEDAARPSADANAAAGGKDGWLKAALARAPTPVFVVYAVLTAFTTYFCMYAFRKPFAAAKFEGATFLGSTIELKTAFVISQIIGYTVSKYVGIKVCSEITPARRAWTLILLIFWAEAALVLFGLAPQNFKVVAIFLNGLPLGMVWGLVVWYLEGRRTSELLLAGLSCSYIVSSGVVKDFGRAILAGSAAEWWAAVPLVGSSVSTALAHVNESWMPAIAGLHFLPLFLLAVWALNQIPRPSTADVADRGEREPMGRRPAPHQENRRHAARAIGQRLATWSSRRVVYARRLFARRQHMDPGSRNPFQRVAAQSQPR